MMIASKAAARGAMTRAEARSQRRAATLIAVVVFASFVSGCASGALKNANTAARAGEWDVAVEQYRAALSEDPDNTEIRIALQRAMGSASVDHAERGRVAELRGQIEEAFRHYRLASEYDPTNRQLAAK